MEREKVLEAIWEDIYLSYDPQKDTDGIIITNFQYELYSKGVNQDIVDFSKDHEIGVDTFDREIVKEYQKYGDTLGEFEIQDKTCNVMVSSRFISPEFDDEFIRESIANQLDDETIDVKLDFTRL